MADDKLVREAVEAVEEMCRPERMSKAEAVDFLEDVVAQLESSMEALHEEIANDEAAAKPK
jgi:hypothetical protein